MDEVAKQRKIVLFQKYGIALDTDSAAKLEQYCDLIRSESTVQNITAVTDESEIWTRHFLDAAYLLRYLSGGSIIDIGTGGGIPGIPLGILMPDLHVTLLDSELRKIEFCKRAVKALGIDAEAICGRAEALAHTAEYRGKFDFAVSRAMTNGSVLCELAIPYLKVGGRLLAMKGKHFSDEDEGFSRAAEQLGAKVVEVVPYVLEGEQKHLIILEKQGETPALYPRRYAKIKRSPL